MRYTVVSYCESKSVADVDYFKQSRATKDQVHEPFTSMVIFILCFQLEVMLL